MPRTPTSAAYEPAREEPRRPTSLMMVDSDTLRKVLARNACRALYASKAQGRNGVIVFTPD